MHHDKFNYKELCVVCPDDSLLPSYVGCALNSSTGKSEVAMPVGKSDLIACICNVQSSTPSKAFDQLVNKDLQNTCSLLPLLSQAPDSHSTPPSISPSLMEKHIKIPALLHFLLLSGRKRPHLSELELHSNLLRPNRQCLTFGRNHQRISTLGFCPTCYSTLSNECSVHYMSSLLFLIL